MILVYLFLIPLLYVFLGFVISGSVFVFLDDIDVWVERHNSIGYPVGLMPDNYIPFTVFLWPVALYRLYRANKEKR